MAAADDKEAAGRRIKQRHSEMQDTETKFISDLEKLNEMLTELQQVFSYVRGSETDSSVGCGQRFRCGWEGEKARVSASRSYYELVAGLGGFHSAERSLITFW
eukprot:3076388-Rhodomonas_salina.3